MVRGRGGEGSLGQERGEREGGGKGSLGRRDG